MDSGDLVSHQIRCMFHVHMKSIWELGSLHTFQVSRITVIQKLINFCQLLPHRFVVAAGDELSPGGRVVDVGHGRDVVHVDVERAL